MPPTLTTNAQLAQLAATELRREDPGIPADAVDDLEFYIERAYEVLTTVSTYDPATLGVEAAREAVVEYAKNRWRNKPGDSGEFPALAQRWMRRAAYDYHVANDLGLLINPDEQAYG